MYYILCRRHESLRKKLNVKTPYDAIVKWFETFHPNGNGWSPEKGENLKFLKKILVSLKIRFYLCTLILIFNQVIINNVVKLDTHKCNIFAGILNA